MQIGAELEKYQDIISMLKSSYFNNAKSKMDQRDSFISRHVYRSASFYLSVPFLRFGFTANQITLISFLSSLVAMLIIAAGGRSNAIIGSLLCILGVLLDYVDGNIARLKGKTSYYGKFIDSIVDIFVSALIPISVSIGLYMEPDYLLKSSLMN